MFIKRVVIQGFKTFAKRTEFIFETGITAVVGPNGSGKSNIVDAVRWCMGEQSYSLLRSKKTSDVIFSGSDKRARLGMAEVILTLDNTSGQVPLDFTEIEITRRAYRDGNNEYLLNGKRVRLQDITDALSHTGLSKRTYAVIGQGLIDRVLNLSPEERRTLFEEAAGITGYQHKRTTTLNRLEATQQNLVRVRDILAELSPRLKYLQRQAERAREYERIAGDLRLMLRDWYGYRRHTTLQLLAERSQLELELREIVTQRQQALTHLEQMLAQLRADQTQLRSQLGDLHKTSSEQHHAAEQISRQLAVANERLHQLQTRRIEAAAELEALQKEEARQQEELAALATTLTAAEKELTERQRAVAAAQGKVDLRQQERTRLQVTLDEARTAQQQVQSKRIACESRLQQLQERINTLEQEQTTQQQALESATAERDEAERLVAEKAAELAEAEHATADCQEQLTTLQAQIRETEALLQTAEQERQQAARALDRLQTRHDLLQRLHDEGAGYASGVRAVVQASSGDNDQKPQLTGILGVIASLIHVPAALDKAIETALGGAMQNIVTSTWQETQAAIEFLKRNGRGRATFLPLDRLRVPSKITAPKAAGILGNAVDLVDYEPTVADAALQLLNRVWVAEDLPAARRALDNYTSNLRPTVVTLAGEIIRPGGAVTGGNDANRRDDSILARERELRGLPAEIEAAGKTLQQHQTTCEDYRTKIQAQRTAMAAAEQERKQRIQQERTVTQALADLRRRLDRAQQSVEWHTQQLGGSADTRAQLTEQIATATAEAATHQRAEAIADQALAAAELAVEEAGVSELLQEVADLRAAAAEAQAHVRNQQEQQANLQRTLRRLGEQLQARVATIERLAEEHDVLETQINALATQDAEASRTLDQLRQQSEPLEARLAELERERARQEENERETQQALRKDESNWNNARLQLQRTEDALTQLQHEIEQDLGLVVVEQSESLAYQPPLELEAVVEQLPVVESVPDGFEDEVRETRRRLSRLTNVNPEALREYEEAAERHEFLLTQSDDLESAIADMRKVISELDELMEAALKETFAAVSVQFVHFFQRLFNGGTAQLILTTPEDITNTGIEIIARPPGKRPQSLALLSGGERTLSACALIFAILRVSPTPFCVLDEVDAALDEANVDRFRLTVEALSDNTQFIIVTHNRRTLEGASAIYGVTMGNDGISRVISLRLDGDRIVHRNGERDREEGTDGLAEIEELVQM
ncbi:MAG: chromosome segregation protein SMC [Caldilineaceae bacterium]|nr:chromosome segregation protein SMC [Caldilineaceae bacterium]